MVLFNYSTKELTAKVVYYGPGLCGKTTNLHWIHEKLPIKNKGKMLSLATETDRTLFFDFLPIELGTIRGMRTRIQLYTVPGQVFYNATRRMVLKGADCLVFVADSQEPMLDANLESLDNLRQNLEANEIDPEEIPMVLQYNKRDLPNALPIEILNEGLNPRGLPFYEAVAVKGMGVEETLKGATGLVFRSLAAKYGGGEAAAAPQSPPEPPPSAVTTRPPAPSPASAPSPRRRTATIPPVVESEGGPEEVLDSLDLEPAAEEEELPVVVDEEEIGMEADSSPSREDSKPTLVKRGHEVEDLRRRISRPAMPEVTLEQEEEEISLPPEPAPAPRPAAVRVVSPPPARPAAPSPPPAPAAAPAARASRQPEKIPTVAPVSVRLAGLPGQADIAIPVEVSLGSGATQVNIHLRLTLNFKVQP